MNKILSKKYHWLFIGLTLLLIAFVTGQLLAGNQWNRLLKAAIQWKINKIELKLDTISHRLLDRTVQSGTTKMDDLLSEFQGKDIESGIISFVYKHDSLIFWSVNSISEAESLASIIKKKQGILKLSNGYYLYNSAIKGKSKVITLHLLHSSFSIQNKYLHDSWSKPFTIAGNYILSEQYLSGALAIKNNKNEFLFYLIPVRLENEIWDYLLALIYFLSLTFLFISGYSFFRNLKTIRQQTIFVISISAIFVALRFLMIHFKFPGVFYNLEIFKQLPFSSLILTTSPGNIFIDSFFIFYLSCLFVSIKPDFSNTKPLILRTIRISALIFLVFYFLLFNEIFETLVYRAKLSFTLHELISINIFSIVGLLSIGLFYLSFFLLTDWCINLFYNKYKAHNVIFEFVILLAITIFAYSFQKKDFDVSSPFILLTSVLIITYVRSYKKSKYLISHGGWIVFLFSAYTVFQIYQVSIKRSANEQQAFAVSLASDHDQIAEYLLSEVDTKLENDSVLLAMFNQGHLHYPDLYEYIKRTYFSGYFDKYSYQLTLCNQKDSVLIKPFNYYNNCQIFFNNLFVHKGKKIENSRFYSIENENGQLNYMASYTFRNKKNKVFIIYVGIDPKITNEQIGYPELLIDDKAVRSRKPDDYSYASYLNNILVSQQGTYPYQLCPVKFATDTLQIRDIKDQGWEHLVYKPRKNSLLVVSKPLPRLYDSLISFSYIFVFYFFLLCLFMVLTGNLTLLNINPSLKRKIQLSVAMVLTLCIVAVIFVSYYLIKKQYQKRQYEYISEKMLSLNEALDKRLSNEKSISPQWSNYEFPSLEDLLRRLSNVLYIDINLYDVNGKLLATSRPEVFDEGLTGSVINPNVLNHLKIQLEPEFSQQENIGDLSFISVYTPYLNNRNQVIAYLNIPYFSGQQALTAETTTFLIAIINIYVLLLLAAISITVFLASRITKPLKEIRSRMANLRPGIHNDPIKYFANDEIGDLIREYNHMTEELEKSIKQLADNERELAWREMARQVAHEIKNPLTPMKLSLQHLQKSYYEKPEDFSANFMRVADSIIEQIDTLSRIATEFSLLAKIPLHKNIEKINLSELISSVVLLFEQDSFQIEIHEEDGPIFIDADRDHISRVIINLLNNAVQSLKPNEAGKIGITSVKDENTTLIKISDNGTGIPDDLKMKLFEPNFTTKTGGTGLGLAIAKSIIETYKGTISFQSEYNKGTVFTISLPSK